MSPSTRSPTRAAVRLRYLPESVVLEVEDHGVGFGSSRRVRAWAWFRCGSARTGERPSGFGELQCGRRAGAAHRAGRAAGDPCLNASITVLLVDDHSLVRRGFRRMLEDDPGDSRGRRSRRRPGGGANSPPSCSPQVVVMDFALPSMNGAVATRQILRAAPETAILILSMHSEAVLRSHLPGGGRARLPAEERDGSGTGGRGEAGGGGQAGARPAAGIARATRRAAVARS